MQSRLLLLAAKKPLQISIQVGKLRPRTADEDTAENLITAAWQKNRRKQNENYRENIGL